MSEPKESDYRDGSSTGHRPGFDRRKFLAGVATLASSGWVEKTANADASPITPRPSPAPPVSVR